MAQKCPWCKKKVSKSAAVKREIAERYGDKCILQYFHKRCWNNFVGWAFLPEVARGLE